MKIVFIPTLILATLIGGFASLFACLNGDFSIGILFLVTACMSGFALWLNVRDDPILEENMVIGEIHPADWQLEEIMTIRLESCLKRMFDSVPTEQTECTPLTSNDTQFVLGYNTGRLDGAYMILLEIAQVFKIDLEKPCDG